MKLAPTPLAFQGRITLIRIAIIIAFGMVWSGYYRIQILQQERYEALGEKCRIKKRRIRATRGLIYDRKENLITQNMPTYNLVLLRDEMDEPWSSLKQRLADFLNRPQAELEDRYKRRSQHLSHPVLLLENIPFTESMRIRRNRNHFPGITIDTTERRHNSYDYLFSHVLGYVGEVSQQDLKRYANLHMGDIVGKSGIELSHQELLTGEDGELTIMIDNRGVYRSQEVTKHPKPGQDLQLTIDFELQKLAYESLDGRSGSVVMMDVNTGQVLVYVSAPSFNLNLFNRSISHEEWKALLESPGNPFLNRPIQGAYAPGSVFKLVTALAALKHRKITTETKYFCNGQFDYHNRIFHCHRRAGHGQVDLKKALEGSCNVFFYQVAKDLAVDDLAAVAGDFGFGKLTGIDLSGEKSGLVPTPRWKKKRFGQIWYPGETLSLAIGQGDLQATPMQLLSLMATISTEGRSVKPHLLYKSGRQHKEHMFRAETTGRGDMEADYYRVLKAAMWNVVNRSEGTGTQALVEGYDVCGKTGTAQLITFTSDADLEVDAYKNAWFAGFAPREKAQVAIVVLVEQAGAGGAMAAPIAKLLFEAYKKRSEQDHPT